MADKKKTKRKADYEVGYGKPPKHSRFKKGQSGNPKGRPEGTRNFKSDVLAMLRSRITINKDGKPRKVTAQQAYVMRLMEKALKGDARAMSEFRVLAQTFNNEEMPQADNLTGDDVAVLDIYNERVLKGAIGPVANAKAAGPESDAAGGAEEMVARQPETETPGESRKRRIKRHRPRRDRENKGDGDV
jgi:hypothetical protein